MSRRRTVLRAIAAGLALLAALAAWDGWQWRRDTALNHRLASGDLPPVEGDARPEVRFAQAAALAAQGDADQALNRYGELQDDDRVGAAARYNAANLLLRRGRELQQDGQPGQALAMIELAKESYRELLRRDPQDWAARYNLERAQRLVPDPVLADDEAAPERPKAERAATTMRGYSPGLP